MSESFNLGAVSILEVADHRDVSVNLASETNHLVLNHNADYQAASVLAVEGQAETFDQTGVEDEAEKQPDTPNDSTGEKKSKEWDRDDLTAYVGVNANEPIRCPWMGGAETTVSEAVSNYPNWHLITEDNQDVLIAELEQLVADYKNETKEPKEEPEKEDTPEEEKTSKTNEADQKGDAKNKAQKVPENSRAANDDKKFQTEREEVKNVEPPTSGSEKISGAENNKVGAAKAGAVANFTRKLKQPTQPTVIKAGTVAGTSHNPANIALGVHASAPGALAISGKSPGNWAPRLVTTETSQKIAPVAFLAQGPLNETNRAFKAEGADKQQLPTFEILEAGIPVIETTSEPEITEQSPLDQQSVPISDEIAGIDSAKMEIPKEETPAVLIEGEFLLLRSEEDSLEPDELYQPLSVVTLEVTEDNLETGEKASIYRVGSESNLSAPTKTTSSEQSFQVSLSNEEIEITILELDERVQVSEPEAVQKVNEILNKISDVLARPQANGPENIVMESEPQEEIKELFNQLLDEVGIEYTPELVESLVALTLAWRPIAETVSLSGEDQADETSQDTGTHEIIKKLLLGSAVKARPQVSIIGMAALHQLCTLNLAA